jgi:hypothetical protein
MKIGSTDSDCRNPQKDFPFRGDWNGFFFVQSKNARAMDLEHLHITDETPV